MHDLATTPTTLERVAVLEQLVHLALEQFEATEHGALWDALIDARAALAAGHTVVTAVQLDPAPVPMPALVCATCGAHLRSAEAHDRMDYLFARDHHDRGACDKRSNGEVRR